MTNPRSPIREDELTTDAYANVEKIACLKEEIDNCNKQLSEIFDLLKEYPTSTKSLIEKKYKLQSELSKLEKQPLLDKKIYIEWKKLMLYFGYDRLIDIIQSKIEDSYKDIEIIISTNNRSAYIQATKTFEKLGGTITSYDDGVPSSFTIAREKISKINKEFEQISANREFKVTDGGTLQFDVNERYHTQLSTNQELNTSDQYHHNQQKKINPPKQPIFKTLSSPENRIEPDTTESWIADEIKNYPIKKNAISKEKIKNFIFIASKSGLTSSHVDLKRNTILHYIAMKIDEKEILDAINLTKEDKELLKITNNLSQTPIMVAAIEGNLTAFQTLAAIDSTLLENTALYNRDDKDYSLLHLAATTEAGRKILPDLVSIISQHYTIKDYLAHQTNTKKTIFDIYEKETSKGEMLELQLKLLNSGLTRDDLNLTPKKIEISTGEEAKKVASIPVKHGNTMFSVVSKTSKMQESNIQVYRSDGDMNITVINHTSNSASSATAVTSSSSSYAQISTAFASTSPARFFEHIDTDNAYAIANMINPEEQEGALHTDSHAQNIRLNGAPQTVSILSSKTIIVDGNPIPIPPGGPIIIQADEVGTLNL